MFYEDNIHETLIPLWTSNKNSLRYVISVLIIFSLFIKRKVFCCNLSFTFINLISWLIPKSGLDLRQTLIPNKFSFLSVCKNRYRIVLRRIDRVHSDELVYLLMMENLEDHGELIIPSP